MALISLIYLIVIPSWNTSLNSKIVGDRIKNPMWLTLLASCSAKTDGHSRHDPRAGGAALYQGGSVEEQSYGATASSQRPTAKD